MGGRSGASNTLRLGPGAGPRPGPGRDPGSRPDAVAVKGYSSPPHSGVGPWKLGSRVEGEEGGGVGKGRGEGEGEVSMAAAAADAGSCVVELGSAAPSCVM